MNSNLLNRASFARNQNGAALIVSLIILAAITLLGVANMESSSVEMKMVASQKERNLKFAIAEAALKEAEETFMQDWDPKISDVQKDTCGERCFTNLCDEGRCFAGVYDSTMAHYECRSYDDSAFAGTNFENLGRVPYWEVFTGQNGLNWNVWRDGTKHRELESRKVGTTTTEITPKYIVEFMCFWDEEAFSEDNPTGTPQFRVTVLVEEDEEGGRRDRAAVMLQSTIK